MDPPGSLASQPSLFSELQASKSSCLQNIKSEADPEEQHPRFQDRPLVSAHMCICTHVNADICTKTHRYYSCVSMVLEMSFHTFKGN